MGLSDWKLVQRSIETETTKDETGCLNLSFETRYNDEAHHYIIPVTMILQNYLD